MYAFEGLERVEVRMTGVWQVAQARKVGARAARSGAEREWKQRLEDGDMKGLAESRKERIEEVAAELLRSVTVDAEEE